MIANEIVSIIQEKTNEKERIAIFDNYDLLFLLSGRESISKYSFPTVAKIDHDIYDEYVNDLYVHKPPLIVYNKKFELMSSFIEELEKYDYYLFKEVGNNYQVFLRRK